MSNTMKSMETDGVFKSDVEVGMEGAGSSRRGRGLMRGRPLLILSCSTLFVGALILWVVLGTNVSTTPVESEFPSAQAADDNDESSSNVAVNSTPYPDCDYTCQDQHPDRIGHNVHLERGEAVCNEQFRFGFSDTGQLFWKNCETGETAVFATRPKATYWTMLDDGTLQLVDGESNDKVVWEKAPNREINYSPTCLHKPLLDCPYIHLHKSGDIVMNSINKDTGKWMDLNAKRAYDHLFPSDSD